MIYLSPLGFRLSEPDELHAVDVADCEQALCLSGFDGAIESLEARIGLLLVVAVGHVLPAKLLAHECNIDRSHGRPVGVWLAVVAVVGEDGHEHLAEESQRFRPAFLGGLWRLRGAPIEHQGRHRLAELVGTHIDLARRKWMLLAVNAAAALAQGEPRVRHFAAH